MLQQTQVARVVPRYLRWLERWPTPTALAAASPADVIREWQGLGYNRRALNLHSAAQAPARRAGPAPRRRDPEMAGARLQPPRTEPPQRGAADRTGGLARRPDRAARCRAVHGRRDSVVRARRAGAPSRH